MQLQPLAAAEKLHVAAVAEAAWQQLQALAAAEKLLAVAAWQNERQQQTTMHGGRWLFVGVPKSAATRGGPGLADAPAAEGAPSWIRRG